jgi:hypothetical protein
VCSVALVAFVCDAFPSCAAAQFQTRAPKHLRRIKLFPEAADDCFKALIFGFLNQGLFNLVTGLLLDMALRVIETNVHGLAIGTDRPKTDLHDLATFLIGFLDRVVIDHLQ